jgi:hypothetical protein
MLPPGFVFDGEIVALDDDGRVQRSDVRSPRRRSMSLSMCCSRTAKTCAERRLRNVTRSSIRSCAATGFSAANRCSAKASQPSRRSAISISEASSPTGCAIRTGRVRRGGKFSTATIRRKGARSYSRSDLEANKLARRFKTQVNPPDPETRKRWIRALESVGVSGMEARLNASPGGSRSALLGIGDVPYMTRGFAGRGPEKTQKPRRQWATILVAIPSAADRTRVDRANNGPVPLTRLSPPRAGATSWQAAGTELCDRIERQPEKRLIVAMISPFAFLWLISPGTMEYALCRPCGMQNASRACASWSPKG